MLFVLVEQVLNEVGGRPADLGAVVVGTGPGTFTGVRIGVASARAAALALDVPVVGVSSLSALAAAAVDRGLAEGVRAIVPVVDARRGQVFAEVYRRAENQENQEKPGTAAVDANRDSEERGRGREDLSPCPQTISIQRWLNAIQGTRRSIDYSPAMSVCCRRLSAAAALPPRWSPPISCSGSRSIGGSGSSEGRGDAGMVDPCRSVCGRRASDLGRAGVLGTPEAVRPTYVRTPDADRHIKQMRDPWRT